MKTTAIDTNALLNYRLQREPFFGEVKKLFEECLDGKALIFIPEAVFLETEWVLRSFYKQPKEMVVRFFEELLLPEAILSTDKKILKLALNLYKNSKGVSFTDCLILNQIQNLSPDKFLTFDDKLKELYQTTS